MNLVKASSHTIPPPLPPKCLDDALNSWEIVLCSASPRIFTLWRHHQERQKFWTASQSRIDLFPSRLLWAQIASHGAVPSVSLNRSLSRGLYSLPLPHRELWFSREIVKILKSKRFPECVPGKRFISGNGFVVVKPWWVKEVSLLYHVYHYVQPRKHTFHAKQSASYFTRHS